jgi:Protein of unknown function, DUF488
MTELYTSSYRAFRPEMGQPVVTSLGLPRWRPEAEQWPRCWLLTPTSALFAEPDEQVFAAGYVARLERFGVAKIAAALHKIARERQASALVLLCHEGDPARCHRGQFADWWIRTTGEAVDELATTTT